MNDGSSTKHLVAHIWPVALDPARSPRDAPGSREYGQVPRSVGEVARGEQVRVDAALDWGSFGFTLLLRLLQDLLQNEDLEDFPWRLPGDQGTSHSRDLRPAYGHFTRSIMPCDRCRLDTANDTSCRMHNLHLLNRVLL